MDEVLVSDGFFPKHVDIPTAPAAAGTDIAVVPKITVEGVKNQLRDLITQLLDVTDVAQAKSLNIAIQRRRVVLILLQETGGVETDGDYHKEMTLLNRMLQGEDMPDGMTQNDEERTAQADKAEALLADRGVDSLAAARIIHVLDALVSRAGHGSRQSPAG